MRFGQDISYIWERGHAGYVATLRSFSSLNCVKSARERFHRIARFVVVLLAFLQLRGHFHQLHSLALQWIFMELPCQPGAGSGGFCFKCGKQIAVKDRRVVWSGWETVSLTLCPFPVDTYGVPHALDATRLSLMAICAALARVKQKPPDPAPG